MDVLDFFFELLSKKFELTIVELIHADICKQKKFGLWPSFKNEAFIKKQMRTTQHICYHLIFSGLDLAA